MNKTAIKNFAIWARRELIESVTKTANLYEIEKDNLKEEIEVTIKGDLLSPDEKKQRRMLVEKIKNDGFEETMEEVAYTWFNRFIAIRFMEVNGYLPSHVRVFSAEDGSFNPEILSECMTLEMDGLDKTKVIAFYNAANKDALFQYLLITQCNALGNILPGMFEKISDYTELLLPEGLLKDDSVIKVMIEEIPEEDWKKQVQIIGWMYQYYNTEPKDKVFSRGNSKKINKEDIPAATQLFTPDWIVKYMVENSLGRLWVEGHPNEEIKKNWKYYIEEAEQTPDVEEKLKEIRKEYAELEPQDIKCIDPSMGSGHILCYLFDVLIQIYEAYGYKNRDAAKMIVENNIHGLDIDERARQLAYFSVMMKARQYDRRFLGREEIPQPKIYAIDESNIFKTENGTYALDYFIEGRKELDTAINSIVNDTVDAKEYGSIIDVKAVNFEVIYDRFDEIKKDNPTVHSMIVLEALLPLVRQAEVLSQKYEVVVTNPPYMGSSGMNKKFSTYVKDNYKNSKSDLFAVFIEKCKEFTTKNGYWAMITQHAWMFLSSYEKLREKLESTDIINMAHLGPRAFDEIGGEVVQTTSFVMRNSQTKVYKGTYARLIEPTSQNGKESMFLSGDNRYETNQENFKKIPGMPIAYWASEQLIKDFEEAIPMEDVLKVKVGLQTGSNDKFIRLWYEVETDKCKFDSKNAKDLIESKKKWIPYNKGGQRRQWYGNYDYLVNWENDGYEIKHFIDANGKLRSRPQNTEFYFREAITWSDITSGKFSIRYRNAGGIHDVTGMSAFPKDNKKFIYILALMSTSISGHVFSILNPTLHLQIGNFQTFPVLMDKNYIGLIESLVKRNIIISKIDWDMHETSWDFVKSPLLANKVNGFILSAYESYKAEVNERFSKLKENEEELNRIFIEIYGLEDELTPEVSDKDITVAKIFDSKNEVYKDIKGNKYIMTREEVIKKFLSYFIGCCMGRYSLDVARLAFAGGEFDDSKYKTFKADEDGIMPLTNQEYFEDDIIIRFEAFLKVTFGEEHFKENLEFIALELKGKASDSAKDKIRNYFMNDFYKDHCKMYQKRPIYWLCDSGKLGASRNLIYMHRYKKDTIARLRIRYVFEIQDRYKQELDRIEKLIDGASGTDRVNYHKQADNLKKRIIETQKYEERVQHLADSYIEIDLDDGVKENYKIFKDILAKI